MTQDKGASPSGTGPAPSGLSPSGSQAEPLVPSADDLLPRLRLLAEWYTRGGARPGSKKPPTHRTLIDAIAHIEAVEDALSKFAAEAYHRVGQ